MTRLRDNLAQALELWFPCVCSIEYTERGLIAPECDYHDIPDLAEDLERAALKDMDGASAELLSEYEDIITTAKRAINLPAFWIDLLLTNTNLIIDKGLLDQILRDTADNLKVLTSALYSKKEETDAVS